MAVLSGVAGALLNAAKAGRDLVTSAAPQLDKFRYPHRCDIWKIVPLATDPTTKVVSTLTQVYALVVADQPCRLAPTSEVDTPSDFGITKFANINTFDTLFLPSGTDIGATYAIVFRTAGDNLNGIWIAQGDMQATTIDPYRPLAREFVFVLREGQPPNGVTNPSRYGF